MDTKVVLGLWVIVALSLISPLQIHAQEELAEALSSYQKTRDKHATEHEAALERLAVKYRPALEMALEKASSAGNLNMSLSIRDEIKRLEEDKAAVSSLSTSSNPYLARMGTSFDTQRLQITAELDASNAKLLKAFSKYLVRLRAEKTKARDIETALKYDQLLKQLQANNGELPHQLQQAAPTAAAAGELWIGFDHFEDILEKGRGIISGVEVIPSGKLEVVPGKVRKALRFYGDDSQIELKGVTWGAEYTLSTWVKFHELSPWRSIFKSSDNLFHNTTQLLLAGDMQTFGFVHRRVDHEPGYYGTIFTPKLEIKTEVWYHLTGTVTTGAGGRRAIYLNGELQSAKEQTIPTVPSGRNHTRAGNDVNATKWLTANNLPFGSKISIDNLRIIQRAVNDDEAMQLFMDSGGTRK